MLKKLHQYLLLMRFDRPIGFYLLLWPTLSALWIASQGQPHAKIFVIFVLGVVITRAAGCVLNDFADRHLDGQVTRTQLRPLIAGGVKPIEAIILFIILSLCGFGLTLLLNRFVILLAIIGVVWIAIYPFMKRITYLPQCFLGLAFAWGVPMAFAAESYSLPLSCWLLFLSTYVWIVAYDTLYAMADREDDLRVGIKSSAILFGEFDRLIVALLQAASLLILVLLGFYLSFRVWYFIGILVAMILSVYQQYLVKDRVAENCFKAFLSNHWVGLSVFSGIFLNYLRH